MPQPIRYQPQELYGEQGDVTTHLGLDPLTGLPVLIYTFPGAPTVDAGVLESENIPGLLASTYDGAIGQVVTAYSPDYELVAPGEVTFTPEFVIEAARGLRDAARCGVVHGDLHPGRFLHAEGHVLIEGYGVPWIPRSEEFVAPERPEGGSYAGDVYALCASLLHLGRDRLSTGAVVALERGLARDPEQRPDARELYSSLKAALEITRTPPQPPRIETTFDELTLPVEEEKIELADDPFAAMAESPSRDIDVDLSLEDIEFDEVAFDESGDDGDPEPLTIVTDPGEVRPQSPAATAPRATGAAPWQDKRITSDSSPGFVKDLPPGATYRSGEMTSADPPAAFTFDFDDEAPKPGIDWRRIGALVTLALVVVAALTLLYLLRPRTNFGPLGTGDAAHYVVNVSVEPSSLPPVTLIVLDSPPTSRWRPGTIFGTVPGQVVLDREGRWSFVGEYQQRRSEAVSISVPEQRDFTLVIPPPPPATEP